MDDWLTRAEFTALARVSPSTLRRWAKKNIGPSAHRVGPRLIRYHRGDVEAWISQSGGHVECA